MAQEIIPLNGIPTQREVSTPYVSLPGTGVNFASTPDSTANSITGDIDIRVKASPEDITPDTAYNFLTKWSGPSQLSYRLQLHPLGNIRLIWSEDGTATINKGSTAKPAWFSNETLWVRATLDVDDGGGNYVVTFYTSTDGVSWTPLGSAVSTSGSTSIHDGTSPVVVGSVNGGAEPWAGKIYYAEIRDGIDGPVVAAFDPETDADIGDLSFVSSATGETWTINQSGDEPAELVFPIEMDQRYLNGLFQVLDNPVTKEGIIFFVKRPGLANHTQPPAGGAEGRGVYAWQATGKIYSVFDDKIYSGTTDLGVSLAASSGRVWFAETPATSAQQLLVVSDGSDNYNITTSDTVTQIDETDDAQYPASNLGPILYVDGYLVQATTNNIVNSELNSFTSWLAADIKPLDRGADIEAIAVQKDQIIAFGKKNIDFLFNVGKPIGSPFQRIEQNALALGLSTKNSLAWSGDICFFVGENPAGGDGTRAVWMIAGLKTIATISTPVINEFLSAERSDISSCTAWAERVRGQLCYVLNLNTAKRTFVYTVESQLWAEWSSTSGVAFNGIAATSLNGALYVQDASNGRIYGFSSGHFLDSGSAFSLLAQVEPRDQGTSNRKSIPYIELVADVQRGGTATLEYSDNNRGIWTTLGTFDMSEERKRIHRGASYKGRRAWRLTNSDKYDFRGQALRFPYEIGSH